MSNKNILLKLEHIENNARRLLEDTAALKEELSGGSGSSISKTNISNAQMNMVLKKFRKRALKEG